MRRLNGELTMGIREKVHPVYILLVLIGIFFGRNLLPYNGNFMGGIDIGGYYAWNVHFIKEQFLSLSIPLWNPYYYCGHPFLANPGNFVFYPFILLYVFLPLDWAFHLDTLIHIIIAALGIYAFVFSITGSKASAAASAVVFSLSGYFFGRITAGHITIIHAASLIPWVFFFVERSLLQKNTIYLAVAGIVLGLQVLGGDPQVTYYTSLFITLYYIFRVFTEARHGDVRHPAACLFAYLAVPFLAFGISAVQILPAYEFMSLSERSVNSYEFATFMSFPPQNFITFLVPNPQTRSLLVFWEFGCYLGIFAIVLAFTGLFFSKRRTYTVCFGVLALVATTIVLGHHTPVYKVYYSWLPLLKTFRVPARCLVMFDFLFSVLVGFGVQHVIGSTFTRWQYWSMAAFIAALAACLFAGSHLLSISPGSKEIVLAWVIVLSSFACLTFVRVSKNRSLSAALVVGFLFFDLFIHYSHKLPQQNIDKLFQEISFDRFFQEDASHSRVMVPGFGNVNGQLYGLPARGMKFHYYDANGNTPIIMKDYFEFVYKMADIPLPELIRHTFAPDLFRPEHAFSTKIFGIKHAIVTTSTGFQMITTEDTLPRASFPEEILYTSRYEQHIEMMKRKDFNPRKTVFIAESDKDIMRAVEHVSYQASDGAHNAVFVKRNTVHITDYSPNRITLVSESDEGAVLLLSELYYPGWKAYVDGKATPILRANYILRAIPLPAGKHDIVFLYRPASFITGAIITAFTLILVFICFYRKYRSG